MGWGEAGSRKRRSAWGLWDWGGGRHPRAMEEGYGMARPPCGKRLGALGRGGAQGRTKHLGVVGWGRVGGHKGRRQRA